MSSDIDLPEPGERRFWLIEHNPKSTTKPLRISLCHLLEGASLPREGQGKGMSTYVGHGSAAAQPTEVRTEAERILRVAARAHEFVGVHA